MTSKVLWGWRGLKTRGFGTTEVASGDWMSLELEQEGWGPSGLGDQPGWDRGEQGPPCWGQEGCGHSTGSELRWKTVGSSLQEGPLILWPPPGLVELLNRVQSSGAHDQRGLLRKEDLVLPEFLQLPAQGPRPQEAPPQTESSAPPEGGPSGCTAHSAL